MNKEIYDLKESSLTKTNSKHEIRNSKRY